MLYEQDPFCGVFPGAPLHALLDIVAENQASSSPGCCLSTGLLHSCFHPSGPQTAWAMRISLRKTKTA